MNISVLESKALHIRDEVMRVAVKNKAGHIASSLSCVDILIALYYNRMFPFKWRINRINRINHISSYHNRDHLILSKAHGCYGLYAILADLGIIPRNVWEDMGKATSILKGCVEYNPKYGLEAGCGSLGHGLPMAVGLAYGAKLQGESYNVYCIVGDGEMQEGSMYEALNFAYEQELYNFCVIVDANGYKAMDRTNIPYMIRDVDIIGINGHDFNELCSVMHPYSNGPKIIWAHTVKGKGFPCMEGKAHFHYRIPTQEELELDNE